MVQEITKLIKRQEVRHPEKVNKTTSPIKRKPDWIRVKAPNSKTYHETRDLMREWKLTTVCEERRPALILVNAGQKNTRR